MNVHDFDLCMGCSLCSNICPTNAINFKKDLLGFAIPQVNYNCIDCSACVRKCVAKKNTNLSEPLEVYASKNRDYSIENKSSSGGVFFEVAKYVLENRGIVYGCVFKNLKAIHERADNLEKVIQMQGSKYIESDLSIVYENIKNDLRNGLVLFVGTPCQVNAIKGFISHKNLITIDLVCHGVPSEVLFSKYRKELENKYNAKIIEYSFRKKSKLYGNQNVYIKFDNNKEIFIPNSIDPYYLIFFSDKFLKKSCYTCKYTSIKRIGDITIGDFWKSEEYCVNLKSESNLSLVLINTLIGKEIFDEINPKYFNSEKILCDVSASQSPLNQPLGTEKLDKRITDETIKKLSLNDILKTYVFTTSKSYLRYKLKIVLYRTKILNLIKVVKANK